MSGSILGQYSVIMGSNINYSARATSETNMLVISIDAINMLRNDNVEVNARIKALKQQTNEKGMPMLDYYNLRKKTKINVLAEQNEFDGKRVFLDAYEKWCKIFKHSRKKEFKFSNLVKFMQNNQMSEVEQKKAQAKELLTTIRPLLQQKIEKLLTSRVEKLLFTVQNQDIKIQKITEVLQTIYQIKGGKGTRNFGLRRNLTSDNVRTAMDPGLILKSSEDAPTRGVTNEARHEISEMADH
mmetsp:Transcript_22246/g.29778  ORF Transcript_22246/g.29778 Transcript_22246/m.29778 type:complete len:241 (-) Transcript_22246:441-1163(-)